MDKNEKPLLIVMEDVKYSLINYINDISNKNYLSYYFLEIILKDIYQEVLELKKQETQKVTEQYKQQCKEKGDDK